MFGDESGLLWNAQPRILAAKRGGKAVEFNANVKPKPGYKPPQEFRSIIGLERIALDIEGVDPNLKEKGNGARRRGKDGSPRDGFIVGIAIGYSVGDCVYYPTAHLNKMGCMNDPDAMWAQLRREAWEYTGEIVGANLQYDLDWLEAEQGIVFPCALLRDVQIAEPLLDENRMSFSLEVLAQDYLGEGKVTGSLKEKYGKDYIKKMDQVDPSWAAEYAEGDVDLPLQIIEKQMVDLEAQGLVDLFHLESELTPLLLQMRKVGVRVNVKRAEEALQMTKDEVAATAEKIRELAGFGVDVWSADSVARAFDAAKVVYPKTIQGRPSFRKEWLNACPHPLAKLIVEQRAYDKIGSTFLNNYILQGHTDGRIHCMFNQLKSDDSGTVSGRFSSSNPNLQNIPTRHPVLGPLLRSIFEPEEDHDLGVADWSQIEFRLLVHFAAITPGVKELAAEAVRLYHEDHTTDFHDLAAQLTGKPRKVAKNINFGVVYGMGVDKMAYDLGVSADEARVILAEFHARSPFMKAIMNKATSQAENNGYIRTLLGRRRHFDDWEVSKRGMKGRRYFKSEEKAWEFKNTPEGQGYGRPQRAGTHAALNALLQGSAADLMKLAMVLMYREGLFKILIPHLTVHDELVCSVPRTPEGRAAWARLVEIMETTFALSVPILASANLGANWDEAK